MADALCVVVHAVVTVGKIDSVWAKRRCPREKRPKIASQVARIINEFAWAMGEMPL